jgi:hypothetical protein
VAVAPDVEGPQYNLAVSTYFAGDLRTTRDTAARLESEGHSVTRLASSAQLYGLLRDAKAARRVFDLVVAHPQYDTLGAGERFALYSAVKDSDGAIDYLEHMVDDNFPPWLRELHFYPDSYSFDAVRSHPKFDELVRRMAMPVDG